ncbi:hypothetical protein BU25DRAFT_368771, partial [Macroventuria anomochaeta]
MVFHLVLTAGIIISCLWLVRTLAPANAAPQCRPEGSSRQTHRGQNPIPSTQRGAHLHQVYPTKGGPEEDGPDPDVDIIAIHGLDTDSEKTWTWEDRKDPTSKVNWLKHPKMLPSKVERVRIFTCYWPADLLQPSNLVQKTEEELALLLFEDIQRELQVERNHARSKNRSILFIASCLGGIILMKALVGAKADHPVRRATRGIIFLATPFRGTSFQDVAAFAEPGLQAWASFQGGQVSSLLSIVKGSTFSLENLVRRFVSLCRDSDPPYQVFNFYEKGKTSLPSKTFPWLPAWFRKEKQLVDESSATLDIVPDPLPLSRPHALMNKFSHSQCTDQCKIQCAEREDFELVSGRIQGMLQKIRKGTPLEQADAWIRTEHYAAKRLRIERLSGDKLPLENCYINLAIVEQSAKKASPAEDGSEEGAAPHVSPFSLSARLKVETPDKNIQVELSSLFDPREDSNGQTIQPRRILIRGRAGIGKTTLCKKMVDEFVHSYQDFDRWTKLFDRVLWVSLRRLKEWSSTIYDLEGLFTREYFAQRDHDTRKILAKELRLVVERGRTLFLLDGLDEVAQELAIEDSKSTFLEALLNQPNVIITSRPHVLLPAKVSSPDLELETIGFYPDQVKAYLQATFTADPKKVEAVQSYLQTHQLIQDLVRIPIQLDALCYTWDHLKGKAVPQTMTATYKAIEESLWKKDILRLETKNRDRLLTKDDIKHDKMNKIEILVKNEVSLLEGLAFTGLYNDVINFELEHWEAVSKEFEQSNEWIPWNTRLPRLSFLRTSELSEDDHKRDYHFLHLTFQEYFAARYFVRQWKTQKPLTCLQLSDGECNEIEPASFLRKHKYDPRYDICWRFVAGLLDGDKRALRFVQAIENQPRDLLGPTHQRLVMHCLSEIEWKDTGFMVLRTKLENQLGQWLLFECNSTQDCWLASEMECPEQVLVNALNEASEDARLILLERLNRRAAVPSSVIDAVVPWLKNCASKKLSIAILDILRHQHKALPDELLQDITARLDHEDGDFRLAAAEALQGRADLRVELLQSIVARLEDQYQNVRRAAVETLQGRADLTEEVLQRIAARLEDKDEHVRLAASKKLQDQANLTKEVLESIAARLEDEDRDVRLAAAKTLQGRADLTEEALLSITARFEHKDKGVQLAAAEALQGRGNFTNRLQQGIAARLKHKDRDVQLAAAKALQGQTNLAEELLQNIAARLEDEDEHVRIAAVKTLQGRASLTGDVLQRIAARLKDGDSDVRLAAAKTLQGRANLTEDVLQRIAARLEDEYGHVRLAAVKTLQGRANLTEDVLQRIAALLKHKDRDVRLAATQTLQGRANLMEDVLKRIAARLEDTYKDVRQAAVEVLVNQAALSSDVLGMSLKPLYLALREKSFKEHLYWTALDRDSIGVGLRHVSLSCKQ